MKRLMVLCLILLSLSSFGLTGCATTNPAAPPQTAEQQAESLTLKSVYAYGVTLATMPAMFDTLYATGKISKDDYNNKVVPTYNRVYGAYMVLVKAVELSNSTGTQFYIQAMNDFLVNQDNLVNLMLALGVDPKTIPQLTVAK